MGGKEVKGETMIIKKITDRSRRDFTAIYECQFCGHTFEGSGYDDAYFHQHVVPDKVCEKCGISTNSEPQEKPTPLTPRYPENMEV